MIKFSILFDNVKYNSNLQNLWGFSCLVEFNNKKILFDTGSNGRVLLKNAKEMNIDLKKIDMVFISHSHWDHIGGLDTVIEENPNITLIVPNTLSKHLIKDLRTLVKEVIVINNNFTQINQYLFSSGIIDNIEQSLAIRYQNKVYIITGCSHPPVDKIESIFKQNLKLDIEYIIGGFHMLYKSPIEIQNIIKNLSSKYITATHCTGEKGIGMLKIQYGNSFIKGGVGAVIEF